jgi:hypothetical protein
MCHIMGVSGVARQVGRPVADFNPFGHPTPYAYGYEYHLRIRERTELERQALGPPTQWETG